VKTIIAAVAFLGAGLALAMPAVADDYYIIQPARPSFGTVALPDIAPLFDLASIRSTKGEGESRRPRICSCDSGPSCAVRTGRTL
jgi:hypothetical protein